MSCLVWPCKSTYVKDDQQVNCTLSAYFARMSRLPFQMHWWLFFAEQSKCSFSLQLASSRSSGFPLRRLMLGRPISSGLHGPLQLRDQSYHFCCLCITMAGIRLTPRCHTAILGCATLTLLLQNISNDGVSFSFIALEGGSSLQPPAIFMMQQRWVV